MAILLFDTTITPHPLILTIKVISLRTCLCITLSSSSLWYAYILFIVLVGGVLILFTYTSSLSPNAIFHLKPQTTQLAYNLFLSIFSALLLIPTPIIINTHNQYQHPTDLIIFFFSRNRRFLLFIVSILALSITIVTIILKSIRKAIRPIINISSTKKYVNIILHTI